MNHCAMRLSYPVFSRASSGRRELIRIRLVRGRIDFIVVLAICNPFTCHIGSGPLIVNKIALCRPPQLPPPLFNRSNLNPLCCYNAYTLGSSPVQLLRGGSIYPAVERLCAQGYRRRDEHFAMTIAIFIPPAARSEANDAGERPDPEVQREGNEEEEER